MTLIILIAVALVFAALALAEMLTFRKKVGRTTDEFVRKITILAKLQIELNNATTNAELEDIKKRMEEV